MVSIILATYYILITCFIRSPQAIEKRNHIFFRNRYIEVTRRVYNGVPAKLGDFPYQISFKQLVSRSNQLYGSFCGGALIAPDKIVSAAHCFETRKSRCFHNGEVGKRVLEEILAVAGNLYNEIKYRPHDSLQHGQIRAMVSITYPTDFDFPINDISIGFTSKPFVINKYVNIIPVATKFKEYQGRCFASGYGRTTHYTRSKVLLWAYLDVVTTNTCSRWHRRNMQHAICVDSKDGSSLGKGDSGGPLVCTNTSDPNEDPNLGILVGVTSGRKENIGCFCTRLTSYSEFVRTGVANKWGPDLVVFIILIYGRFLLFL